VVDVLAGAHYCAHWWGSDVQLKTAWVANLLRAQRATITKGGTGEQTKPNLPPQDRFLYVFCLRHFSVNGSKSLVMDEISCSIAFLPKKTGELLAFESNFGLVK
jgi:hypothetical protein